MDTNAPFLKREQGTLIDISETHGFKPKKFMITNFHAPDALPSDFSEVGWLKLDNAIQGILYKGLIIGNQELYKTCEMLCRMGHGSVIHSKLKDVLSKHAYEVIGNLKMNFNNIDELVINVQKEWKSFAKKMSLIRSIFIFLDQYYALPTPGIQSSWDMGLSIFKARVVDDDDISKFTTEVALKWIRNERSGEKLDRELLKDLLRMIHDLNCYTKGFEDQLLEQAESFYTDLAQQKLSSLDFEQHLDLITKQRNDEMDRSVSYLSKETEKPLLSIVYKHLLLEPAAQLLEKGFDDALINSKLSLLSKIFLLFSDANGLSIFNKLFYSSLVRIGEESIKDPEKDSEMIDSMMEYREKILKIVVECFQNLIEFQRTMSKGFEDFMATRGSTPAKLLAKSLDSVLRNSHMKLTTEEIEVQLDRLFSLFKYIQGKDIFEAFYKQSLAKRLLLNRSSSQDTERSMISKLKQQIGSEYTEQLEGMFADIDRSDIISKEFKEQNPNPPYTYDFNVNVLTQAIWPTYIPSTIKLPDMMNIALDTFSSFYLNNKAGRRLFWQHSLSKAILIGNFEKGKKELTVSLFQAIVLLLFNSDGPAGSPSGIKLSKIREITELENDQLKLTLASLSSGKLQLLHKSSKNNAFNDDDIFHLNVKFQHPHSKIKVNSLQLKETTKSDNRIQEQVIHNRQFLIDAFIVRLLKTKRTMNYSDVVSEALRGLTFPANSQMIKTRIENLIEREFLEREDADIEVIKYVA